jgi:hypothetical protein
MDLFAMQNYPGTKPPEPMACRVMRIDAGGNKSHESTSYWNGEFFCKYHPPQADLSELDRTNKTNAQILSWRIREDDPLYEKYLNSRVEQTKPAKQTEPVNPDDCIQQSDKAGIAAMPAPTTPTPAAPAMVSLPKSNTGLLTVRPFGTSGSWK